MDVMVERGCGLDVHQAMVVACLLTGPPGRRPRKEIRSFRTLTAALREMRDWLRENGCTHVAMESTGVYWQPITRCSTGDSSWWSVTRTTSRTCRGARPT